MLSRPLPSLTSAGTQNRRSHSSSRSRPVGVPCRPIRATPTSKSASIFKPNPLHCDHQSIPLKTEPPRATAARATTGEGSESLYKLHFLNELGYKRDVRCGNERFPIDVVAVHGIRGDPFDTWAAEKSKCLWLRDLLPKELPGARIFSFGYDARIKDSLSVEGVRDFALELLNELNVNRQKVCKARHPITFSKFFHR